MQELKPCPFCGKADIKIKTTIEKAPEPDPRVNYLGNLPFRTDKVKYSVGCSWCQVVFESFGENVMEIIEKLCQKWNTRHE